MKTLCRKQRIINFDQFNSMWNNSYLPEDLMLLVLLRLPAKSLLRFKTVSKSWKAQISCPKFIKLHHLNQSHTKPDILLCNFLSYTMKIFLVEIHSEPENVVGNIIHRLDHPYNALGLPDEPLIVGGPCNGLLCLSHEWKTYILFNPLTKSFWPLPKNNGGDNPCFYGFGYDDIHDDYKLFIAYGSRDWFWLTEFGYKYEIYSFRSNSWISIREVPYKDFIDLGMMDESMIYQSEGVLVNCVLHWAFTDKNNARISVLAFDLREEKFSILSIPKLVERHVLELSTLNGCLLLKTYHNMWVMKDYGLKDSWIKIDTQMPYNKWLLTPAALLDGKRKMVFYKEGKLTLYDLVKDEDVESRIIQECKYNLMPRQHEFVASLVDPLRKPSTVH